MDYDVTFLLLFPFFNSLKIYNVLKELNYKIFRQFSLKCLFSINQNNQNDTIYLHIFQEIRVKLCCCLYSPNIT